MFGIQFVKAQPTTYLMKYRAGAVDARRHRAVDAVLRAAHLAGGGADRQPRRRLHLPADRTRLSGTDHPGPCHLPDQRAEKGRLHAQLHPEGRRQDLRVRRPGKAAAAHTRHGRGAGAAGGEGAAPEGGAAGLRPHRRGHRDRTAQPRRYRLSRARNPRRLRARREADAGYGARARGGGPRGDPQGRRRGDLRPAQFRRRAGTRHPRERARYRDRGRAEEARDPRNPDGCRGQRRRETERPARGAAGRRHHAGGQAQGFRRASMPGTRERWRTRRPIGSAR